MFAVIITFLETNVPDVFDLFLVVLSGGIGVLYDSVAVALTDVGEIVLLSAVVGLAMFGLQWIRSLIPFVR